MHVIKTRRVPGANNASTSNFTTGSGLDALASAKPAPEQQERVGGKSVPPSTRQLARDYAAFYGMEGNDATS